MVRELFEMARSKKACIIFFDEIDAVGGTSSFSFCSRWKQLLPLKHSLNLYYSLGSFCSL